MLAKAGDRRVFWGLMLLAVVLRVVMFNPFALHHPDEVIQYLEQAHRLTFGYGLIPWEYREGIRPWAVALLLTPPMMLGRLIAPASHLYLILPRAMLALFNLAPVGAAWFIGYRHSRQAAIVAMAVTAVWIECLLFSVSVLTESLATSLFMVAAALLYTRQTFRSAAIAGALLAAAAIVRVQYVPAIGLFALLCGGRDWVRWRGLLAGGIPMLIAGGIIDVAMGSAPYAWVWNNIRLNLVENRMSQFGGLSPWTYLLSVISCWLVGILIIPYFAGLVWREHRTLLSVAVLNLVFHQLIGHREYRFIWLSLQIILVVAAIGSTKMLEQDFFGRRFADPRGAKATLVLVGLWALASLGLSATYNYRVAWRDPGVVSQLAAKAMNDPAVCGLAEPVIPYWLFGAWATHSNKPLFLLDVDGANSVSRPGVLASAFNATVTSGGGPPGFSAAECRDSRGQRVCLYRRPGGCTITPEARPFLAQQRMDDSRR